MAQNHGSPPRGLMSAARTAGFEGAFGRMFPHLPSASFGLTEADNIQNLNRLGRAMVAGVDPPKDGGDGEESGIPALYTYFGQFIDHDLTFDPASSLQRQNDPDALVDFRTPAFDLDNVYGRGPDDQPYMYDGGAGFLLGKSLLGGIDPQARDLPRNGAAVSRALIGDPRNDENVIVSQLQGLFLRFHNRLLEDNPGIAFGEAQQLMRAHYQFVVVNDFLPRIVSAQVLDSLKTDGLYDRHKIEFYKPKKVPYMPIEFSAAAYRLGHSMVRPGYRLNDSDATLLPIFPPDASSEGLTGFRAMNANWGIDWGRFIDLDIRAYDGDDAVKRKRLQFAYRIDTALAHPLSTLPSSIGGDASPSLAGRNLIRGWRLGLPSGQHVARKVGATPLDDEEILIGQALDAAEAPLPDILSVSTVFKKNCPLWTYVLAEAMHHRDSVQIPVTEDIRVTTPKLGPVGGRIVAEVFLGLLFNDPRSVINFAVDWTPPQGPGYTLKDFVAYALGQ